MFSDLEGSIPRSLARTYDAPWWSEALRIITCMCSSWHSSNLFQVTYFTSYLTFCLISSVTMTVKLQKNKWWITGSRSRGVMGRGVDTHVQRGPGSAWPHQLPPARDVRDTLPRAGARCQELTPRASPMPGRQWQNCQWARWSCHRHPAPGSLPQLAQVSRLQVSGGVSFPNHFLNMLSVLGGFFLLAGS